MAGPRAVIGRLSFEFQRFTYGMDSNRQRPIKVSGILSAFKSITASAPFANIPNGDTIYIADPSEGFDRGHVILVSHSGVSDSENIVPMYPCFNQAGGLWRDLEYRIAYYVGQHVPTQARSTHMTVEIEYGATDPRFPTAFLVTVEDRGHQGGNFGHLYFRGVALNRYRITHLPTPPAVMNPVTELGQTMVTLIQQTRQHIVHTGWKIEDQYPPMSRPFVAPLTDVPNRPYAMLDYLWLVQQEPSIIAFLTNGCSYTHRFASQFHERQKMLIRIVNAMNNAGAIKSDYPGDTTDSLIIGSGQRSAQVDHVFPYDKHGGNLFSNALIASGAFNNRMRTAAPATKWGDTTGVNLYSTTQHL